MGTVFTRLCGTMDQKDRRSQVKALKAKQVLEAEKVAAHLAKLKEDFYRRNPKVDRPKDELDKER